MTAGVPQERVDAVAETWVDSEYIPTVRKAEKCELCGQDMVLRHHCPPDVDKVAEAIWTADRPPQWPWECAGEHLQNLYRRMARAAIAAWEAQT